MVDLNILVKNYLYQEKKNKKKKIKKLFYPIFFENHKIIKSKIKNFDEIFDHINVHHVKQFEINKKYGIGKFKPFENKIKNNIKKFILKYTKNNFIEDDFSRAVISYRYIIKNYRPCNVLEIGPGCGYLSILLNKSKFNWSGVELNMIHYLYQKILINKFNHNNTKTLFHLQWWKVDKLENKCKKFKPRLIIFNHCLNEISLKSLKYYLQIFNNLEHKPEIVVEGLGSQKNRTNEESCKILDSFNFKLVKQEPFKKFNIARALSMPIMIFAQNQSSKLTYFSFKSLISMFFIKTTLKFIKAVINNIGNIKYFKLYFLDFMIIKKDE